MSEASKTVNTIHIGALVPDELSTADIAAMTEQLRVAGEIVREAGILSTLAVLGGTDPAAARDELLKAAEMHWASPPHLSALHDALADLMGRRAEELAGEPIDFTDCRPSARRESGAADAFRMSPGYYVPGAVHAKDLAAIGPASVDGFIDVGGVVSPWVFSAGGVGRGGVFELGQAMIALGFAHGYIVGTSLRDGAVVPANITYIEVK